MRFLALLVLLASAPALADPPTDPAIAAWAATVNTTLVGRFAPPLDVVQAHPDAVCGVELTIVPDGALAAYAITEPSGVDAFDKAALHALRGLERFDPPPAALGDPAKVAVRFRAPRPADGAE